jgi:hypothetical protein
MNKEFNRMLKLAGLMTEGLYTAQMYSEEPVMEAPMEKMTKEKLKAKIKEMMLPEETIGQEAEEEMGSMDEASPEAMDRMSGLSPVSSVGSLIDAARRIISALKEEGFEEEDIYDYIMDKIRTLSIDETLFEAKKDEEEEAPEDVDIDVEAPVEYNPDPAGTEDTADTSVDVNMDGVPDVDTGSSESKKAFTNLVDTYNSAKELGDPKLTQMIANALTYYNKNIILKSGQPQA